MLINTKVLISQSVSQYVEFDSTAENFTGKMFKFVLKMLYVKLNYTSQKNYVQPSTR